MEVILIEQMKNLGKVGDVVRVKSGFARNFLIPYNKALRATKDNIAYFETQKAEIEKKNEALAKESAKVAKSVEGSIISVIRQASEDGRLYGSVNARDIVKSLEDSGIGALERRQIILSSPIKYIGVYAVTIALHAEVSATIHVNVARSDDEAKINAEKFKRGEVVMEGKTSEIDNNKDTEIVTKEEIKEKNEEKASTNAETGVEASAQGVEESESAEKSKTE